MSDQYTFPWPRASVTGLGSLPGTDSHEAARLIAGEIPEFVHVAELPDRGPGADMVGRAAATLVDFPVELHPSGWRVTDRDGQELRRARSLLSRDLDAAEEHTQGYTGPAKVQLAGPWTLAANIELRGGQRLLADTGAVRDLCAAYTEGLVTHLKETAQRFPHSRLVLQLDEPTLPRVLRGGVPRASGYGYLPAPEPTTVQQYLGAACAVAEAAGAIPVVHCCDQSPPVELLRRCGARVLALDATLLDATLDEALGSAVEAGLGLFLGIAARADEQPSDPGATVDPVRGLWHRIGLEPEVLSDTVVITPRCGLAGHSPAAARTALVACHQAARVLLEEPRKDGRG